jgi:hypothetical protein
MLNFTGLASVPSHPLAPFTGRLRPAVAAYLARFKGSSRERRSQFWRWRRSILLEQIMKRWVGDSLAMQDEFGGGVAGFDVVELVADWGKGLGRGGAWWSGQGWQLGDALARVCWWRPPMVRLDAPGHRNH